jgi:SPOR domain
MTTAAEPAPTATRCERCGAPLASDQEWCIECGTARTMIQRPRGWTIPLAVVGTVVLLFAAGFAIALINLSSEANRDAAALSTTTSKTASPTTSSPSAPPFAKWPPGVKGWTVVLAGSTSHATAEALATPIRASGITVGILDSSRHKAMTPGQWLVFAGHYPTQAAAQAQARTFVAQGHPALVKLVAAPPAS